MFASTSQRTRRSPSESRLVVLRTPMALLVLLFLIEAVRATAGQAVTDPQATSNATGRTAIRIGEYDSRAIAVAYAHSPQCKEKLVDLQRQHSEASKAGDKERVAELNAQGEAMQVRMHLQGFSNAPVDDVLATVRESLAEVAKASNVAAIVAKIDYRDESIEVVDVTDALVALFGPDQQTLKMIASVREQKPLPIEKVAKMPSER